MNNSDVLNSLKSVKERIPNNYSSGQLMDTLDYLILSSIEPICNHTSFMDQVIGALLAWSVDNPMRKISAVDRNQAQHLMSLFLLTSSPANKIKILKKIGLERNILFASASRFLEITDKYQPRKMDLVAIINAEEDEKRREILEEIQSIETSLKTDDYLYTTINDVSFWLDQAQEFKNKIIEKYMRHVVNKATAYYNSTQAYVDIEDVVQNFILAVSKAIDKSDATKGTLTSYINTWLRNARVSNRSDHFYGIAYKIPQNLRRDIANQDKPEQVNIYESMHDDDVGERVNQAPVDGPEEHLEHWSDVNRVRVIAKYADPAGFARISMGIEEYLEEHEVQLQLANQEKYHG